MLRRWKASSDARWPIETEFQTGKGETGLDEYEVRVYDEKRHCRLVAAVEIVSPANKDRPEHRHAFVAARISVTRSEGVPSSSKG